MHHKKLLIVVAMLAGCAQAPSQPGSTQTATQTVKITPLGSHDGEFCPGDRALLFEDPDGTRILFDAGRTVRGPTDPRLGNIDAVLLSHVHSDHLGDLIQPSANAGQCAKPEFSVNVAPNSNTVNITVAKNARLLVGGEMMYLFQNKLKAAGGDPGRVQILRFGASAMVGKVEVSSVPAEHSNGLPPEFLDKQASDVLRANGLTAYVGPPGGYVLRFSNGLVAYLSGDTGIIAEQDLVIRRHYKASLAIMNIGGVFSTGPVEAAYVVNELVQPKSVIASHANEPATINGKLTPNSRTAAFTKAAKMPVHAPLSGRTMQFDGNGSCVSGC